MYWSDGFLTLRIYVPLGYFYYFCLCLSHQFSQSLIKLEPEGNCPTQTSLALPFIPITLHHPSLHIIHVTFLFIVYIPLSLSILTHSPRYPVCISAFF